MTLDRQLPSFRWTGRTAAVASLLAADALTDEEIAARHGISERQIRNWKQHPEFQTRIAEHVAELEAATLRFAIAKRRRRVGALDDRWRRMQQVIEERAADEASGTYLIETDADGITERRVAPGWTTGLLVRTEKQIGTGDRAVRVTEYAVDTGLLRELRAHEEQAAKELGQWAERQEVTGRYGGPIRQVTEHTGVVEVRAVDYRNSIRALAPADDQVEGAG